MPNRRIVIMTSRYDPYFSGPALQAKRIISLMERKYNFSFKIITQKGEKNPTSNQDFILIPEFRLKKLYSTKLGLIVWTFFSSIYLVKNRKEIDIIHSLDLFFPSVIFGLVSKIINKPFLAKSSIDGVITKHGISGSIKRLILRKTANIIAISKNTYNELVSCNFDKEKIIKIPNGVDISTFYPLNCGKKDLGFDNILADDNRFIALFTGSIAHRKGVLDLLRIWKNFIQEEPNSMLILAGSYADKSYVDQVEEYIRLNKIEKSVTMKEHYDQVWELYQASDIYLFCSFKEGLPNSILEAMATGLPIIARDIPGCNDLIVNEVNGYLIKDQDDFYQHFLLKLLYMKSNKLARENMRRKNIDFIRQIYSLEKVAELYKITYDRILADLRFKHIK